MGQGFEITPLPFESIQGALPEGAVDAYIGGIGPPDVSLSIDVFHVLKLSACKEIMLDIVKRPFHLSVTFLCTWRENHDPEVVLVCERLKLRVDPNL